MKTFLTGFAYFLLWTTPIQIAFFGWIMWDVITTDETVLSFTGHEFFNAHLRFIHTWLYSWFWNAFLDFIWALPIAIISGLKLVINTWIGWKLLPYAKAM